MNNDPRGRSANSSFDIDPTVTGEVLTADFERPETIIGQILEGRFLIEKDLADSGADKGGLGLVYLALDQKMMNRKVVIKILRRSSLESPEIIRKFQHEKEALIRLNHPNIVTILDSGTLSDGNPFLVMEYIQGFSLRKVLRDSQKIPLQNAAHYVESIGSALAAAHSQKVLHRDLKPENIMLTPQEGDLESVKLIDFGIARVEGAQLAPETEIGRPAGTLKYMAPEQLKGQLQQTTAIDVYALSVVTFEMLAGSPPFDLRSTTLPEAVIELHEMQRNGIERRAFAKCGELPCEAVDLLIAGIAYDPGSRPLDVRQFSKELASALRNSEDGGSTDKARSGSDRRPFIDGSEGETHRVSISKREIADDIVRFEAADVPAPKVYKTWKPAMWAAALFLVLAIVSIPIALIFFVGGLDAFWGWNVPSNPLVTSGTIREISYYLNVQKMRDGKLYESPFKSSGQEVFESGYKFSMVVQPTADGYMYIFNEGKDDSGKTRYYLLFPTPSINNYSPKVSAEQKIETAQNTFAGSRGTEVIWMIWSKDPNNNIESIRKGLVIPPGAVREEDMSSLQSFLKTNRTVNLVSTKDSEGQKTVVKASGDVVVHRFELEHR